jgi:hypothetical protein
MTSFIAGYFGKSTIVKKFPKKKKKNENWKFFAIFQKFQKIPKFS